MDILPLSEITFTLRCRPKKLINNILFVCPIIDEKKKEKTTITKKLEKEVLSDGEREELDMHGADNIPQDDEDDQEEEEEEPDTDDENFIVDEDVEMTKKEKKLFEKEKKRLRQSRYMQSSEVIKKKKVEKDNESSDDTSYKEEDNSSSSSSVSSLEKNKPEDEKRDELEFSFEDEMDNLEDEKKESGEESTYKTERKRLKKRIDEVDLNIEPFHVENDSDDDISIKKKDESKEKKKKKEKRREKREKKRKRKKEEEEKEEEKKNEQKKKKEEEKKRKEEVKRKKIEEKEEEKRRKREEKEDAEEDERKKIIPFFHEYKLKGTGLKTIMSPLLELTLKLLPTPEKGTYEVLEILSIKVPRYITISEIKKIQKEVHYFDKDDKNVETQIKNACMRNVLATEQISQGMLLQPSTKLRDMFNGMFTLALTSFEDCAWFLTRFDCSIQTIHDSDRETLDIINFPNQISEFREFCKENRPKSIFWNRLNIRDEEKNIIKASEIYNEYKHKNKFFNQKDLVEKNFQEWSLGLIEELSYYEDISVTEYNSKKRITFKRILDETEELFKLLENTEYELIQYENDESTQYQRYILNLKNERKYLLMTSSQKRKNFFFSKLSPIFCQNPNNNNGISTSDVGIIIDRTHTFSYPLLISILKNFVYHNNSKDELLYEKPKIKMIGSGIININNSPFRDIISRNDSIFTRESDKITGVKFLDKSKLDDFIKNSNEVIRIYHKDKRILSQIQIKKENQKHKTDFCSIYNLDKCGNLKCSIIYAYDMDKSDVYRCLQHTSYFDHTYICSEEIDYREKFGF